MVGMVGRLVDRRGLVGSWWLVLGGGRVGTGAAKKGKPPGEGAWGVSALALPGLTPGTQFCGEGQLSLAHGSRTSF